MNQVPQLAPPHSGEPGPAHFSARPMRSRAVLLGLLAALTLAVFGDVLFPPGNRVLSNGRTDVFLQFIHWRQFGFEELRRGNLALWNPHLFCGAPFFGGFQSALLYPPNVLFLLLPVVKAINWSIALHVFLAGAFTCLWTAQRGLHPLACFLSAVMFMFCGAHFPHIYAGHLPNLCTLVWAPLLFLAIDGLFEKPSLGWSLVGMFAVAMQLLAGHPQYVFYTAVAAAIYSGLCCFKTKEPKGFLIGLAGIALGGAALSAVQLLTSLQESRESLRGAALPYDVAAVFSFPRENFLTLLAPGFFGNIKQFPYWGRCFWWETSLFVSVTGLSLAAAGAFWGDRRRRRFAFMMLAILLVLALGSHTPLFGLLYHWAPGFDRFRGWSKFTFLASLMLALLAGIGLDLLLKGGRLPRFFSFGVGSLAILLAAGALCLRPAASLTAAPENPWHKAMLTVRDTGENCGPEVDYDDPALVREAALYASNSLWLGAGTLATLAALLALSGFFRRATPALALLAATELLVFARQSLDTFVPAWDPLREVKDCLQAHPGGDYRILNLVNPNAAMTLPANDIWGLDPGVPRRYAEFLAFTQGQNPDKVTQDIPFSHYDPLYGMLRCRFSFMPRGAKLTIHEAANLLPRLELVSRFEVISRRDAIFAALADTAFNPRQEVILETAPSPEPQPAANPGTVKLVDSSTDCLIIEAEVSSPSILLVTDTYARGWRALPLKGSTQASYQVVPANYCLRAVPLAAGHHRLRLEYSPSGFRVGKWVSAASALAYCGLLGWVLVLRWRSRRQDAGRV